MRKPSALRIVVAGAAFLAAASQAGSGRAQLTFEWATVGNPGNAADTLVMNKVNGTLPGDGTTGYGSVGYTYRISKYDVTNSQYVAFLNKVDPSGTNNLLFITNMTNTVIGGLSYPAYTGGIDRNLAAATGSRYSVKAGQENFPVVQINWSRAARFVNWLANGQGSGGTESGVYDMSVFNSNAFATPPSRAANATVFLPTENEYYKAAYYDPTKNGGAGGYWQYGTRSDTAPASIGPPGTSNSANLGAGTTGASGNTVALTMATTGSTFDQNSIYLTNVGAYTAAKSYYGLFDVDGLVYNWTEASRENRSFAGQMLPVYRGGSWFYNEGASGAAFRNTGNGAGVNTGQYQYWGFRVASLVSVVTINVASGTQTQTQAGFPLLSGSIAVEKTGAGMLVLDQANTLTAPITVTQGGLQLATASSLSSSAVTVAAGATLTVGAQVAAVVPALVNHGLVDVGLGGLTVTSGQTAEGVLAAIVAGRADGTWSGTSGITSSAAAMQSERAVGWLDNGDGSFTVAFGAAGDWNLNGVVDFDDVLQFVSADLYDTGLPATWADGDFDYNGVVDFDDVLASVSANLFDTGPYNTAPVGQAALGFGGGAGPGLMNGGFTAVPEPATWALGACGLVACVLGRIRKATQQPGERRALHLAVRSSYGSGRGVRREGDSR